MVACQPAIHTNGAPCDDHCRISSDSTHLGNNQSRPQSLPDHDPSESDPTERHQPPHAQRLAGISGSIQLLPRDICLAEYPDDIDRHPESTLA